MEEIQPYLTALQAFIVDFGLTPASWVVCECTVYHHGLKYGGTLDGVVDVKPTTRKAADFCARVGLAAGIAPERLTTGGVRVIVDLKSREGEDAAIYPEYVLQQTGYRFAETMMPKLGLIEMPMLATDAAVILQVRPDGYTFRPVLADGRTMAAFRAMLDLHRWASEYGEYSTQVQAFPRPAGWKAPTWERATPPTGGLCGCAYCDDPADGRCMFGGFRPQGPHTRTVDRDGNPVTPTKRPRKAAAPIDPDAPVKPAATRPRGAARKAAATTTAGRQSSATIASLTGGAAADTNPMGRPGAMLRDEDIPF
jgi:hypothetical protein